MSFWEAISRLDVLRVHIHWDHPVYADWEEAP